MTEWLRSIERYSRIVGSKLSQKPRDLLSDHLSVSSLPRTARQNPYHPDQPSPAIRNDRLSFRNPCFFRHRQTGGIGLQATQSSLMSCRHFRPNAEPFRFISLELF